MALLLTGLSPDLIDRILGLDDMSSGVLNLWLSGDKRTQHQIANGLTRIEYRSLSKSAFKLPEFLADLRALRDLHLSYPKASPHIIQVRLLLQRFNCSALRNLHFDFVQNITLFEYTTNSANSRSDTQAQSTGSNWTIKSAFPQLESLELPFYRSLKPSTAIDDLPASLTRIEVCFPSFLPDSIAFTSALPRGLLSLVATGGASFPSLWKDLPPHLTELRLCIVTGTPTVEEIASLPRSLTRIEGVLPNRLPTRFLPALPKSLNFLKFEGLEDNDRNQITGDVSPDLGSHLPHLKELSTKYATTVYTCPPGVFRSLPSTVTSMNVGLDLKTVLSASDWPSSLTELHITETSPTGTSKPFTRAECFPDTLKLLTFTTTSVKRFDLSALAGLPKSLLAIDLLCAAELPTGDLALPPHLTSLKLRSVYQHGPRSTSWVQVEHARIVFPRDEDEDSGSDEDEEERTVNFNIDMISHLERMKVPAKLISSFPFEQLSSTSITELSLACALPASKVKFLPRTLKSLEVGEIFFDTDFNPKSSTEKAAMIEIHEIGYQRGILDSKPSADAINADSAEVHPMSLLPRTLTFLSCRAVTLAPTALKWASLLPPRLSTLIIAHGFLPARFLQLAPLKHASKVAICVDQKIAPQDQVVPPNKHCDLEVLRMRVAPDFDMFD